MTVLGLLAAEELEPKGGDCSGKVYTYTIQLNRQSFCDKHLNHTEMFECGLQLP